MAPKAYDPQTGYPDRIFWMKNIYNRNSLENQSDLQPFRKISQITTSPENQSAFSVPAHLRASAWSERVKNTVDTVFFALRALCRAAAQSSADRIGETLAGFLLALPLLRAAWSESVICNK
jgi:hypothetical protein